ncbi:hypothetical protein DRJ00_03020 [Candidatus Aerophobetes bacterium]|uniref:DUF402 domain-containing protein n=1 Tax=Aerophobetes bacterium TaxID=2030807 RepID=A0A497E5L0_UNCAE|nr:DUF402 domain-containing protein [Candidatus Aerophobetes bacterium]RLE09924.1 MAG: hypothetical protein DRJ00_03020 [Candidatus Aerophobetes bacterium]
MEVGLKIRGIYATALTKFFLEHNLAIVQPSRTIKERFRSYKKIDSPQPIEVKIRDLEDRQGISLQGEPDKVKFVAELIRKQFFDAICWKRRYGELEFVEIEFPYLAKSALDELRNEVLPTVANHHRLRIIASEYVDLVEKMQLTSHPERRKATGEALEKMLIWDKFEKGKMVAIDHVKLNGKIISLSEGKIIEISPEERKLVLKRTGYKGKDRYDGLELPKEEGDYALTEVREGSWFYKHTYHRRDGKLLGEYYNINTPVEFYPDKIRYVDLEIDVIRWPDGKVKVVEEELLEQKLRLGFLSEKLARKAKEVAEKLRERLCGKGE